LSEFYETIALSDKKRSVGISYGSEQCAEMRSLFNTPTSEFLLEIPITLIDRIVSSVRNKILTVALELEGQGIMGEGMTFTKEEKLTASQNNYSITIGTMNGSQIQQATTGSTQSYTQSADIDGISAFVEKLLPSIDLLHNNHTDREQIRSDLETIRSLIKAPSPRFSMIRECLHSVKAILEGASGNLLAAQCLQLLPPLIASIPV
jgi:hypothetical protein